MSTVERNIGNKALSLPRVTHILVVGHCGVWIIADFAIHRLVTATILREERKLCE